MMTKLELLETNTSAKKAEVLDAITSYASSKSEESFELIIERAFIYKGLKKRLIQVECILNKE